MVLRSVVVSSWPSVWLRSCFEETKAEPAGAVKRTLMKGISHVRPLRKWKAVDSTQND